MKGKYNYKSFIFITIKYSFLSIIGLNVIFAKKEPNWFLNSTLDGYENSAYYIGVGSGKSLQKAQEEAQSIIAGQLEVSISSVISSSVVSNTENDLEFYRDNFKQNTQSIIDLSINGIEIVKSEKQKRIHYVFSVLDKQKYSNGLKVELDRLNSSIISYQRNAREALIQNQIFLAIQHYMDLHNIFPAYFSKKSFYNFISPVPYIDEGDLSLNSVISEVGKIISKIKIDIISGNKQSALLGRPLPKPMIIKVYYKDKSNPISGMPIIARYKNKEICSRGLTDENGEYDSYVYAISSGNIKEKIFIEPNFSKLESIFRKYLKNVSISLTYQIIDSPPMSFGILVQDKNGNSISKVENKILKSIQKLGHYISDDSDLLLSGIVYTTDQKEVEGKNGIQYLSKSELDLNLSFKKDNTKIANFTIIGKGLSKKSFDDAEIKSYQKFKISQKDFSTIFSKSENRLKEISLQRSTKYLEEGKKLFSDKKFKEALSILSLVSVDEKQEQQAIKIINKIQKEISQKEKELFDVIENEKEQKRDHELSRAKIEAENTLNSNKLAD